MQNMAVNNISYIIYPLSTRIEKGYTTKMIPFFFCSVYIVTRLISDVHFHITGPKLTFKTYNYRHCDTSMSPKTADYFSSGRVIATLLGNCKVLCYANMNVTLFRVSANQISVFSITQQSR